MLLAELLLCAPLAIWWANFARQYKKPLTGSIKTATEYLAAEEPPAAAQQPQAAPTPQSCPASLRYLLRVRALTRCFATAPGLLAIYACERMLPSASMV